MPRFLLPGPLSPAPPCRRRALPTGSGVTAFLALLLLAVASPRALLGQEGSLGAAVVGGMSGGVSALWAFPALTGCPVVTVGAAREADACDTGALLAGLGGTVAGAWIGASNSGAGYGMGVGAAAGFATAFLAGRVTDVPRWLNAVLVVGGAVAGGLLWADEGPGP